MLTCPKGPSFLTVRIFHWPTNLKKKIKKKKKKKKEEEEAEEEKS
jgi:hypothetical protein